MVNKLTMAAFSPKSNLHSYNVRSISFPSRSHSNVRRLEEKLNKLSSFEGSAPSKTETICNQLSGLGETYRCMQDLLNLPLTLQAVEQQEGEKWVSDMLDDLIRYLDVCGSTREAMLLMKESVRELQSALRRSKLTGGELMSIESNVHCYINSRKKMKKDAARSLASLKNQKLNFFVQSPLANADNHLSAFGRVCREVGLITTSIFDSLLQLLSRPTTTLKPKPSGWSLVSKLMHKGVVACEVGEEVNELESVDTALNGLLLCNSSKDADPLQKIEAAQKKMELLDIRIEEIENALECLFRHLIHARVALLNILSHKFTCL